MINKQELLAEQASLDQQEAKCRETIAKADAVRRAAEQRLLSVSGAREMVNHLIKKIDVKEQDDGDSSPTKTDRQDGAGGDSTGTADVGDAAAGR